MCTRGTWLVLVRANQTRRGPGGHVRRQHRAEFPVALRIALQCQVLLEPLLASVDVRKMRKPSVSHVVP